MRSFSATITINAPAEQVWAAMADVVHWPQWLPTVTAVEPINGDALAVGREYRIYQPRLLPAVWTVTAVSAPRWFAWQSQAPGVRTVASHTLVASAGGATQLRLEITFSGPLAFLAVIFAGRLTDEYLHREAAALKRWVESGVVTETVMAIAS